MLRSWERRRKRVKSNEAAISRFSSQDSKPLKKREEKIWIYQEWCDLIFCKFIYLLEFEVILHLETKIEIKIITDVINIDIPLYI